VADDRKHTERETSAAASQQIGDAVSADVVASSEEVMAASPDHETGSSTNGDGEAVAAAPSETSRADERSGTDVHHVEEVPDATVPHQAVDPDGGTAAHELAFANEDSSEALPYDQEPSDSSAAAESAPHADEPMAPETQTELHAGEPAAVATEADSDRESAIHDGDSVPDAGSFEGSAIEVGSAAEARSSAEAATDAASEVAVDASQGGGDEAGPSSADASVEAPGEDNAIVAHEAAPDASAEAIQSLDWLAGDDPEAAADIAAEGDNASQDLTPAAPHEVPSDTSSAGDLPTTSTDPDAEASAEADAGTSEELIMADASDGVASDDSSSGDEPGASEGVAEASVEGGAVTASDAASADAPVELRASAELKAILEALIFASPEPLTRKAIGKLLASEPVEEINGALAELKHDYERPGGLQLVEVANGYQIVTRPDLHDWVRRLFHERTTQKLSVQALETLAVIAYRQPVTALEVTEIRGVTAAGVLNTLLERHLVKIVGRKKVVGRPFLYATTKEFLIRFGLNEVGDLPRVEEMAEALGIESPLLTEQSPAEDVLPLAEPEDATLDGAADEGLEDGESPTEH
jgi:segregation and condensation protein B